MKTISLIMVFLLGLIPLFANDAFNKVMAKNRASKGIGDSNYKVINNKKEFYKAQKNGNTIGMKVKDKKIGKVYNYVEIKNVKLKDTKEKRSYGLSKIKNTQPKKKLYGVQINKNFKGRINNTVKVKNSNLN